jgi:hypothetical protein
LQGFAKFGAKKDQLKASVWLSDFEDLCRLISGHPPNSFGAEWGLLVKQKLEGNALFAIDAFHKKLNRAPTYVEMKAELIARFDCIVDDVKSLKSKFNKLTWDDSSSLAEFLLQFQNLAILFETKRSNSDLVVKLRSQMTPQINLFLDTSFAGVQDPPLPNVLTLLRASSFINLFKN